MVNSFNGGRIRANSCFRTSESWFTPTPYVAFRDAQYTFSHSYLDLHENHLPLTDISYSFRKSSRLFTNDVLDSDRYTKGTLPGTIVHPNLVFS
jgi:hypothetical protein